jgi:hypothetical protein
MCINTTRRYVLAGQIAGSFDDEGVAGRGHAANYDRPWQACVKNGSLQKWIATKTRRQ